jgi:hypothetical protein
VEFIEEEIAMPQDPKKRQKALMKKRSKEKAASQRKTHQQQGFSSLSAQAILRRAQSFPLFECWISSDWDKKESSGLVQILLARKQPDGNICFGVYLVDKFLLGLKNTFANAGFSPSRYQNEVRGKIFRQTKPKECPIELAHQMIYASIDYAAQFGFTPEKDFATSQYLLAPRGELAETYKLTFGNNGKPLFVAGPHDNAARIIRQLDKTVGPGNYDYMMPIDAL